MTKIPMANNLPWLAHALHGLCVCSALLVLYGWPAPATAAPLQDVSFQSVGTNAGLNVLMTREGISGWFDVDLDGDPDPVWVSDTSVMALVQNANGVFEVKDLLLPAENTLETPGGGGLLPIGVIDSNRDGIQELVVAAGELILFEIHEPYVLTRVTRPMTELPGFRIRDIATADLNNDGWSDMVLSGMCFGTNASGQLSGAPDLLYMNVGGGYFEMSILEPSRTSMTNGITAADIDGDGRIDLLESIDVSSIVGPNGNYGPGRLLMNTTSPGDRIATFEVSDAVIDTGNAGMGFCVEDLDQDGYLDLYNTSLGIDQLMMGQPGGTFIDETFERGIVHEYGPAGQRMQWSPSFVDFNMDGLLDIFVREGGFGLEGEMQMSGMEDMEMGMDDIVASNAVDLIYLQQEDGYFVRSTPPENLGSGGRQATTGDMNGDGRADIGLGGLPGTLGVFLNETPVDGSTRYFGVRFKTTVSAWPPTGARLIGTCGDHTMTRSLASGGKQGGVSATQLFFAFPECSSTPLVEVEWPSGARSSHTVPADVTDMLLEEPHWCATVGKIPENVMVDPDMAGGNKACVGIGLTTSSCCSVAEGPCDLEIPVATQDQSPWVRLDSGNQMALPRRAPFWTLITEPSPPKPGQPVTLHVIHSGDPLDMPDSVVSLFVNGSPVQWEDMDLEAEPPILTATVQLPPEMMTMDVSLFPVTFPDPTWTLHMNTVLDSRMLSYEHPIARHVTGGVTELWDWMAFPIGRRGFTYVEMINNLQVSREDGTPVEWAVIFETKTMARMQVVVSWDAIGGADKLILHDGDPGMGIVLPVLPAKDLESVVGSIGGFRGGVTRTRISRNRDVAQFSLTLLDHQGNMLPPEDGLVTLEVGGAYIPEMIEMDGMGGMMGVSMSQSMFMTTDPDWPEDEGYVNVIAADGRVVGTSPFWLRPAAKIASSIALSGATLSIPWMQMMKTEGTHEVKIAARNELGELLGSEAEVSLVVHGGVVTDEVANNSFGQVTAMVKPDPGVEDLSVDVYLDGKFLTTLETKITDVVPLPEDQPEPDPTDPTGEDPTITDPDPGVGDETRPEPPGDEPVASTTPTPSSDDGGCAGSAAPLGLAWVLAAMGLLLMTRRRSLAPFGSRRPHC